MPKMLTTEEAAEALRVSAQTVVRYIKSGELQAVKVRRQWLINEEDLQQLLTPKKDAPKANE